MLKRFLCVYAIAFSLMSLQAIDTQQTQQIIENVIGSEKEQAETTTSQFVANDEIEKILPGALACDSDEGKCVKILACCEDKKPAQSLACCEDKKTDQDLVCNEKPLEHTFACKNCN